MNSVSFPNYLSEMTDEDIQTIGKMDGGVRAGLRNPETRDIAQGLIDQGACACPACCSIAIGRARYALGTVKANG